MIVAVVLAFLFFGGFWNGVYKLIIERDKKDTVLPNIIISAISSALFIISMFFVIALF